VIRQVHLLRRGWPDKSIDLLIRALILQIDDARLASCKSTTLAWHGANGPTTSISTA